MDEFEDEVRETIHALITDCDHSGEETQCEVILRAVIRVMQNWGVGGL
jgi:hypothetical protein